MKKHTIIGFVSALLLVLAGIGPAAPAKETKRLGQGPVMKAHFIDVGQANATLLEFPGAPGRGRADRCRGGSGTRGGARRVLEAVL